MRRHSTLRARSVAFSLLASISCGRIGDPEVRFRRADFQVPFEQRLRYETNSPLIVLGTVLDLHDVGQPRAWREDSRVRIQATPIKIQIEEVIRRGGAAEQMEFLYVTFSARSEVDLGQPRYIPDIGQRRIYFLTPSGRDYRSVRDVLNYPLHVYTGSHRRGFCRSKPPGQCIAEILLIPQADFDPHLFSASLYGDGYATAEVFASRPVARGLLQKLVTYPDERISMAASELNESLLRDDMDRERGGNR